MKITHIQMKGSYYQPPRKGRQQFIKDIAAWVLLVFILIMFLLIVAGCNTPRRCIEPEPIGAYHNLTEADSMAIYNDIYQNVWGWQSVDLPYYIPDSLQDVEWSWSELIVPEGWEFELDTVADIFRRNEDSCCHQIDCPENMRGCLVFHQCCECDCKIH